MQHQLHELERIESEAAGDANDHDESELNALVDEACASLKLQARLMRRFKALTLCVGCASCDRFDWCWRTVRAFAHSPVPSAMRYCTCAIESTVELRLRPTDLRVCM